MKKVLIFIAFIAGYLIMSLELLGSRLLAPYFGASIYVWGSLIGLILIALAGGYYLGGWLAERPWSQGQNLKSLLDKLFLVVAVFLLLDLFFYSAILKWLSSWDIVWGALAASLIIFCIPMVALAAVSPLIIKILSEKEKTGQAAGLVYSWGTAGSILGTFLTTFCLIPYLGSRLTLYSCFFIALLVLVGLFLAINRRIIVLPILFFLISLTVLRPIVLPQNVILEEESAYNQIRLIDSGQMVSLILNSQKTTITQSAFVKDGTLLGLSLVDFFNLGPLITPVNDLLVLGMAGGASIRQYQQFAPQIKIDAVEIDSKIINIAEERFGIKEKDNLKIYEMDARPFLVKTQKKYGAIEIDLFQGSPYIPFYATTKEFFQLVSERLNSDGVMLMNVFAPGQQEIINPLAATISSIFPSVFLIPIKSNYLVLASNSALGVEELKNKLKKAQLELSDELKPMVEHSLIYLRTYQVDKKTSIFTDDWAPVEQITYKMLKGLNL